MTIQYHKSGDYYLPNLVLEDNEVQPIGKYGRMRKHYLKEHRPVLYSNLLLSGKLFQHLAEIDGAGEEHLELLWVRHMNSIRSRAEEIVLHELVYAEEARDADT